MTDSERLFVVEEKLESIKDQQARFFSHFQSEERARDDLKNRVTRIEERLDSGRWTLQSVMAVISTLTAIAVLLIMILQK